jgi:hypothetical protein
MNNFLVKYSAECRDSATEINDVNMMMLKLKTMYDKEADWLTKKTTDEQKLANFEASVNKEISRKRQKTSESLEFVKSLLSALIRAKREVLSKKDSEPIADGWEMPVQPVDQPSKRK